jgi:hypothetical protein
MIMILDLFNPRIFIKISFFQIVKFVPANSEHLPASLKSSPAIDFFRFHALEIVPAIFDSGIKNCDSTSGIKN